MCTVTFLPKGNNNFILTSNRDESPKRSLSNIEIEDQNAGKLMFPRDKKAGGTWIACSESGKLVCILNGAFDKHKHLPPYRKSRGLMAFDFFEFDSAKLFFSEYQFEGIEPFTMVTWDKTELYEVRWDGEKLFPLQLDKEKSHIWSSSTLYPSDIQSIRKNGLKIG